MSFAAVSTAGLKAWFRKHRFLCVLVIISALWGLIQFGEPIDRAFSIARNKIRVHPVSGQIVIVGIDDESLMAGGPWPWKRDKIAQVTDNLFKAGAKRVFFDLYLQPQGQEDADLVQVIKKHSGRVFVAANIDASVQAKAGDSIMPMDAVAKAATIVSVARWVEYWGGVGSVPYKKFIGGSSRNSIEAELSGVKGEDGEFFQIDYSFSLKSIPYFSAANFLAPVKSTNIRTDLKGKDVVIGYNMPSLGTVVGVPGQRRVADVFVVVLGAETLKYRRPISLGWMPLWPIGLLGAAMVLHGKRRGRANSFGIAALLFILILPLSLEPFNIFTESSPALFLLLIAMIRSAWQRFGARQKNAGTINPISGLFTTNAIRHDDRIDQRLLVAARIRRFSDVVTALPPNHEQALIKQIVGRLEFGVGGGQLLHGDDGNFFWLAEHAEKDTVIEQFHALHVIFRNPIRVLDKSFDVDVSFGLDQEFDIPLSHRMVSALAAAHAADQEAICWRLHDPAAASEREWSLSLLGELDQALQAGRVWVAYQPKVDMRSKQIIGAEALVRWTHETRGPISPAEFVAMAERHGRIDKLTEFVLDDALRVAKEALAIKPDFTVSVNMSPSLLNSRAIVDMVKSALNRHRVPPSCLILELTETVEMEDSTVPVGLMQEFRAMGLGLSIDDYGTGLSTLEYLRMIPATELKVDRRFTSELCASEADRVVMRSTIELAHALGMQAVAEGIETAEALTLLVQMNCDLGQGYHLARPMEADRLKSMLEDQLPESTQRVNTL